MLQKGKEKDYYVSFIDILGFNSIIDSAQEERDEVVFATKYIYETIAEKAREDLGIFTFTDCVYVVAEEEKLPCMLEFISSVQMVFLNASKLDPIVELKQRRLFLLRGSITKGKALVDQANGILGGQAINKAYELESKNAIYPRIILDPIIIKENLDYFICDIDGMMYFDFIKFYQSKNNENGMSYLKDVWKYIREFVEKNDYDWVNQKYNWFSNYIGKYIN